MVGVNIIVDAMGTPLFQQLHHGCGQRENAFARFCFGFLTDRTNIGDELSGTCSKWCSTKNLGLIIWGRGGILALAMTTSTYVHKILDTTGYYGAAEPRFRFEVSHYSG